RGGDRALPLDHVVRPKLAGLIERPLVSGADQGEAFILCHRRLVVDGRVSVSKMGAEDVLAAEEELGKHLGAEFEHLSDELVAVDLGGGIWWVHLQMDRATHYIRAREGVCAGREETMILNCVMIYNIGGVEA